MLFVLLSVICFIIIVLLAICGSYWSYVFVTFVVVVVGCFFVNGPFLLFVCCLFSSFCLLCSVFFFFGYVCHGFSFTFVLVVVAFVAAAAGSAGGCCYAIAMEDMAL